MHPSTSKTAGPIAAVIQLPPAGRDEQLARWGLADTSCRVALRPSWSEEPGEDTACAPHQGAASRTGFAREDVDYLRDGGWTVVSIKGDGGGGGLSAHRGVLHPDEYVDHEALVFAVERELGYSFDDVHAVYRQGRLSENQRELRGRIDARLLALSRSGANMLLLGRIMGLPVKPAKHGGNCRVVDNALRRARTAEEVAA